MPIRFSTEAANADILGEDTDNATAADASPQGLTDRAKRETKSSEPRSEATPGTDINAAGFIKDKDAGKP
jgi:hypothetical protein